MKLIIYILFLCLVSNYLYSQCPDDVVHNTGSNNNITVYIYDESGNIIDTSSCLVSGNGNGNNINNINCTDVLDSLNNDASYLAFDTILGSCIYDTTGEKIDSSLPIELNYFDVYKKDGTVVLKWQTLTERNNHYFKIERSYDGYNWELVDTIIGAGNNVIEQNYMLTDIVVEGLIYYKLIQYDFDGKFVEKGIRSVYIEKRKIVKILNITGQTVNMNYNGIKIIIYNNGEQEKIY